MHFGLTKLRGEVGSREFRARSAPVNYERIISGGLFLLAVWFAGRADHNAAERDVAQAKAQSYKEALQLIGPNVETQKELNELRNKIEPLTWKTPRKGEFVLPAVRNKEINP